MSTGTPGLSIDARMSALSGLIDYAGLFPPAALDMAGAVAGYRAARRGPHHWIVGRFLCPVSRLEELAAVRGATTVPEPDWSLGLLLDGRSSGWEDARRRDLAVAGEILSATHRLGVSAVETPLPADPDPAAVARLASAAASLGAGAAYFEVPGATAGAADVTAALDVLALAAARAGGGGVGAKLRCGGVDPTATPTPGRVAAFIHGAAARNLAFKATAGLHHPIGGRDAATGLVHHGFVNVFAAAGCAAAGAGVGTLEEIVADEDPASFGMDAGGVRWRTTTLDAAIVDRVRRTGFSSFGSCDVEEPIDDLVQLTLLPKEVPA